MPSKHLKAAVLTHLPFEDLGSLEPELLRRGFSITTLEAPIAPFPVPELLEADLLVVLGGPIGVYDTEDYPFLNAEIEALRQRFADRKPTLGICLGAQLIAAAFGARVYPGHRGSEIGWSPLQPANPELPDWFQPLMAGNLSLFHWHGDTFDLPPGAKLLASTECYRNQAFTVENFALALQFHPEVTERGLERWFVGHNCELRAKHISVSQMRAEARMYASRLEQAAAKFWRLWLNQAFDHIL